MLATFLILLFLFIALGIILSRIEARIELKKRREHLRKRGWKSRRSTSRF